MRLGRNPNQQALIEALWQVLPASWGVTWAPAIYLAERTLATDCPAGVSDDDFAAVAARNLDLTGYRLLRRR